MRMSIFDKGIVAFVTITFFCGCKKFVQINPPTTKIVTSDVFNDPSSVISSETVIYTQMWNSTESFKAALQNGLLADEFTNYSTSPTQIDLYKDDMTASLSIGCWTDAYNYIYE